MRRGVPTLPNASGRKPDPDTILLESLEAAKALRACGPCAESAGERALPRFLLRSASNVALRRTQGACHLASSRRKRCPSSPLMLIPFKSQAAAINAYSSRRTITPGQQGGSAESLGLNSLCCCAHARNCGARHARTPERAALGAQPQLGSLCWPQPGLCATAPMTRNAPYGCLNWTGHAMPLASCPRAASTPSSRPPQGDALPPQTSSPPPNSVWTGTPLMVRVPKLCGSLRSTPKHFGFKVHP